MKEYQRIYVFVVSEKLAFNDGRSIRLHACVRDGAFEPIPDLKTTVKATTGRLRSKGDGNYTLTNMSMKKPTLVTVEAGPCRDTIVLVPLP